MDLWCCLFGVAPPVLLLRDLGILAGGSLVSAWCCVASLTCVYGLGVFVFRLFLCLFSCCFGHTRM